MQRMNNEGGNQIMRGRFHFFVGWREYLDSRGRNGREMFDFNLLLLLLAPEFALIRRKRLFVYR